MEETKRDATAGGGRAKSRPRILCIVDGPDWIFKRHAAFLERFLSGDFEFSVAYRGEAYDEAAYDLIYPLEFNMVTPEQIREPRRYVTGLRSFVAWADWDFLALTGYLTTHFLRVHAVSRQLYDLFAPYLPGLAYVTHGVDTQFFTPAPGGRPAQPGRLRLGWAGNRNTIVKGYRWYIEPLGELEGIELVYCGYADRNLPYEEMPGFYRSIDAYVCASSYEGNNNSLLEAASAGVAILTTPAGTAPEYLQNEQSALIVARDLAQFKAAAERLRDDPSLRARLGQAARQALIEGGWDWQVKAEEYRRFFWDALNSQTEDPARRTPPEPRDLAHYAAALKLQYELERELRIGHAYGEIVLRDQVKYLEAENEKLRQIRQSAPFRLYNRIASWKAVQALRGLFRRADKRKSP